MDELGLARLLREQDGVVARRQVLELGGTPNDVRRKRRRREWTMVHPGVYVHHSGPLTRRQRLWAAVLACGSGAVLHRESALEAHGLTRDRSPAASTIYVAVEASRRVDPPPGVRVERVEGLTDWVPAVRRPPRTGVELAALKVTGGSTETGAIAVVADVCRQGLTTPDRLVAALTRLPRLTGRARLLEVLSDVASGAHSVLEHRYLDEVERAHGLPRGVRQRREVTSDGVAFRDVLYVDQAALVELDGRFGHTDTDDRWDDLDRDIASATTGRITLHLGWRQVLDPCRLATAVGAALRARGWHGAPIPCGPDCMLDAGGSESPGDPDPPQTPRSA
ncbi:MAG: hypothetical protein WKF50_00660 [Nocardioides sp.]